MSSVINTSLMDIGPSPGDLNPFLNRSGWMGRPTLWKRARQVFVACTLLPLRVALTLVNVLIAWVLCRLAIIGLAEEDLDPLTARPFELWRQWLVQPTWWLCRFQILLFGFWRIPVKGRQAKQSDAPIIVANHVSGLIDGMLLSCDASLLAEVSYASLPVANAFVLAKQCVLVDRTTSASRSAAKKALLRRCTERGWQQTVIFPEGTCTNGSALVQFKAGAFAPGKPVQPVLLRYSPSPCGDFDPSFTAPLEVLTYALGLMMQIANFLEVEFLPVVTPTELEVANELKFAQVVQNYMAQELGVPSSKHASEDLVLATAAQKMGLPFEAGLVRWHHLTEDLAGMRVKSALKIMEQFKTIDANNTNEVDFEGFASVMRNIAAEAGTVPDSETLRSIFNILDRNEDGTINFEEYLSGAAVINGMKKEDRTAGWALAWDLHAHGRMGGRMGDFGKEQVRELVERVFPHVSERFDDLWPEIDGNKDGHMSKQEFLDFAEKYQAELHLRPNLLMHHVPLSFS